MYKGNFSSQKTFSTGEVTFSDLLLSKEDVWGNINIHFKICIYIFFFHFLFVADFLNFSFLVYNHHHHHVVPLARISLTLYRHFSLSFIASGRSLGLHPVSSHSCCMYVRAGRPAFVRPCVGVHWSTSLMSSSLLLQL